MQPRFLRIKSALLESIENGDMRPGDQVPSENQLSERFSVSRMTARRALTELVDEGVLLRSHGVGTFVSDHRPMSSMLTIRSINEEIEQRGHRYHNRVLSLESIKANETQSLWLDLEEGQTIFFSRIVHFDNDLAIQIEERWVNPQWAPDYLEQDYAAITASQYLNLVAPLTEADHVVEAISPSSEEASLLDIPITQPCLKISRRTFSAKGVVSFAQLLHPGNRFRLGGHLDF
jgi:GntR family histidine utilization transcriptional repressor